MTSTYPIDVLGCTVSGDLGPFTIYTDRKGRKVWFPRSPPKSPPTELQNAVRGRFAAAQAEYMALDDPHKYDWEHLVRVANLCMTGQNLFIHVAMMHTQPMLETLIRQTGVDVVPPTPV